MTRIRAVFCLSLLAFGLRAQPPMVERWGQWELTLPGPAEGNPFLEHRFGAEFHFGHRSVKVDGFYDGDGRYVVRFMPDETGVWSYSTQSDVLALEGRTGRFTATTPGAGNHGPVGVSGTIHFAYADGSAYYPIGTTCYAWNKNEPQFYPFPRSAEGVNDYSRFDPAFFRHLEQRIKDLQELGLEADLILFHPYDRWGYQSMSAETDDRYLRYTIARLASFRNVWWSLANEYDFMKAKQTSDWDRFFRIVTESDPYSHLRSIHHSGPMYDPSKPWVTHLSVQSSEMEKAAVWLQEFKKPVIYDECKYEPRRDVSRSPRHPVVEQGRRAARRESGAHRVPAAHSRRERHGRTESAGSLLPVGG